MGYLKQKLMGEDVPIPKCSKQELLGLIKKYRQGSSFMSLR